MLNSCFQCKCDHCFRLSGHISKPRNAGSTNERSPMQSFVPIWWVSKLSSSFLAKMTCTSPKPHESFLTGIPSLLPKQTWLLKHCTGLILLAWPGPFLTSTLPSPDTAWLKVQLSTQVQPGMGMAEVLLSGPGPVLLKHDSLGPETDLA